MGGEGRGQRAEGKNEYGPPHPGPLPRGAREKDCRGENPKSKIQNPRSRSGGLSDLHAARRTSHAALRSGPPHPGPLPQGAREKECRADSRGLGARGGGRREKSFGRARRVASGLSDLHAARRTSHAALRSGPPHPGPLPQGAREKECRADSGAGRGAREKSFREDARGKRDESGHGACGKLGRP